MERRYPGKQGDASGIVRSMYYGVDLHKDQLTYHCIIRCEGGMVDRMKGTVSTDRIVEEFIPMLTKEGCYVIVEASCSSFTFAEMIREHCTKAFVVNPLAFKELYTTGKKTDTIDARKLADRLMYHIEMKDTDDRFPEVYVPDAEAQMTRKLLGMYMMTVKRITQVKNRFKAVFRSKIIKVDDEAILGDTKKALMNPDLDEADRFMLRELKEEHERLLEKKERVKAELLKIGTKRFEEEIRLLVSIRGVSVLGSVACMADIVTIDRFPSSKQLTSYLSSTMKVDASGKRILNGGLNKRGRKMAYRFLLQGIEHIVSGNTYFAHFAERHGGKKSSNKIRSALVRKTMVAIFYILKNKEEYRFIDKVLYQKKIKEIEKIMRNVPQAA